MKKKILFVISSLEGGGAEKVLIDILKYIDREKYLLHLALFNKKGLYLDEVPRDVPVYGLGKVSRYSFFNLQRKLNSLISELAVDIVISFMNYASCLTLMSKKILGWEQPVIVSERTTLTFLFDQQHIRWQRYLTQIFYPHARVIIVVSGGVKRDILGLLSLPEEKIRVIYNPLDIDKLKTLAEEPLDLPAKGGFGILAVGRLIAAKDYPTLLKAVKKVKESVNVHLSILGEGEDEERLRKLSQDLRIDNSVSFLGFQQNPYKYMARSDLFVLSSRREGFPNVLTEAMTCGVPVIATECPSGPGEIISDGVNGLLVPVGDETKLAQAIVRLLKDEHLRKRLAEAGRKRAEDFGVNKIVREYEAVFEEAL